MRFAFIVRMVPLWCGVFGIALTALPAEAVDCTAIRAGTHDFDQKRAAGDGIDGLPGDGSKFCVPTTWTSWMAYLNQHGFPSAMGQSEAVDWTDPAMYNAATDRIELMGFHVNATASHGAWNPEGIYDYLGSAGLGDAFFMAVSKINWTAGPRQYNPWVSPELLSWHVRNQGMIGIGVAWTDLVDDVIEFNGSHIMGVPVVVGECDDPLILIRDPSGGGDLMTQSTYDYTETRATLIMGQFHRRPEDPILDKSIWQLDAYGDYECFLTGIRVLYPNYGAALPPALDELIIIRPWATDDDERPVFSATDLPASHIATAMEVHPTGLGAVVATFNFFGSDTLMWYDFATETLRTFEGLDPHDRLALDREGFAWVLRGGRVERIFLDVDGGGSDWEVEASFAPEVTPDIMMYSDHFDLLLTLSTLAENPYLAAIHPVAGHLAAWSLTDADLDPPYAMGPSRGGEEFWIGSEGSNTVYRYGLDLDAGIPVLREAVVLAGLPGVQSIHETDAGRLLVVADDSTHEFSFDDDLQQWIASDGSRFGGWQDVAYLRTSCNRSSALRFANPEDDPDNWHVLPEEDHESCPGDLNHDGVVDFADILLVLASWGPCEYECTGDAENDHDVDFGDVLVILATWGPCP